MSTSPFTLWFPLLGLLWAGLTAWQWRRARSRGADLLAGGALFLLITGFFWRTLSGDVYQPADGGDLVSFLFPTYRFAAGELSAGRLPLWNPALYAGAPFLGDIQSGFFYLPHTLLFLLWPQFPYRALQWSTVLHLYWAALGAYVLIRSLRPERPLSRPAAIFGAVAFALSDPLLVHLGNLNLIAVLAWLPWVLAAFHRAVLRRSWRWVALTGLALAVAGYAGHAQSTLYLGLALLCYTAGSLSLATPDAGPWRRRLLPAGQLAVAGLVAGLLLAPILLPALEMSAQSVRSDFSYQDAVDYSLAPAQAVIGLVTPGFFGRGPALHWSLWQRVETPFAGVATLLLAIGGLLLAGNAERRLLRPWLLMAAVGLLTGLGVYAIVHGWLTLAIPLFDQFRAPARALVLWTLPLAVLAAVGVDTLQHHTSANEPLLHRLLGRGALLVSAVVIPLVYGLLLLTQNDETAFLRTSLAALALLIAAGAWVGTWAVVAGFRAGWLGPRGAGVLLIAVLFLDLSAAGAYTDISPTDPTGGFQHPEMIAFLQADPELYRIDSRTEIQALWQPNTAALAGLQDVGGVANPLALRRWQVFWESTGGRATRRYDLLNVKYVLVAEGTPLPDGKFAPVAGPFNGLLLYRNRDALPRAWLAPAGVDLTNYEAPATVSAATVTSYHAGALDLTVASNEAATVLISEIWDSGWQAQIDGAPAPLTMVNGALMAVTVAAGSHTIQLRYWPPLFTPGLIAAAVGLLLAAALLAGQRRQPLEKPERA